MSNFGKKYLNYWPYQFNSEQNTISLDCLRWNKTNKEFQLGNETTISSKMVSDWNVWEIYFDGENYGR